MTITMTRYRHLLRLLLYVLVVPLDGKVVKLPHNTINIDDYELLESYDFAGEGELRVRRAKS